MPKHNDIKSVLILGSGPIIIGQAAEFDYAGAQACLSLREEGIKTILLNSNPATIMTDSDIADRVYIEPMTLEVIDQILKREKPDGILPTLGGQNGLNLAMQAAEAGLLKKHKTKLLGTQLETIYKAEDRDEFRKLMLEIGEPIAQSKIANSLKEAKKIGQEIGLPLIIRPAYTMGGSGGGIAHSWEDFLDICGRGLKASPISQILVEEFIGGLKEIEYEVMRDSQGTAITICNMENMDPVGIHTGDSIVVAPSQTLADKEYQMLRQASLKIIDALGVEGGCNIQFALDTKSFQYYVIEVNPRVSRSSALASKATGYPIARISAKIAVGLTLDEIPNAITQKTVAAFEPALDYIVVKIPRLPFDKFPEGNRVLSTQMKATGEVMSIDRTFEGAFQKAIRSLDTLPEIDRFLDQKDYWVAPTDLRPFLILHALENNHATVEEIAQKTKIDMWFLQKLQKIVAFYKKLKDWKIHDVETLKEAKRLGFSDEQISSFSGCKLDKITNLRKEHNIKPVYKIVDTCAGEFDALTPYYYSTWEEENEAQPTDKKSKAIVVGSGPIRIGQGIEFDYCSVHAAGSLSKLGVESIMVNNNPETVSTDFDISDRLYFEPLTCEDIINIYHNELTSGHKPKFILQFGGQTSLTIASKLAEAGILPHKGMIDSIELASNRDRFEKLLRKLKIPYPQGQAVRSPKEAIKVANKIGYPVLIRPSFVLGGRAMEILYSENDLDSYIDYVFSVSPNAPVLVDRYLMGKEVEIDLLYDGEEVLIPGIMEHIERSGVHSGDSMAVYPTQGLTLQQIDTVVDYSTRLAKAIGNKGLTNIQYVINHEGVFVIEANPRGSRTVPFLSKVTGIAMVQLATSIIYGKSLKELGYLPGLFPDQGIVAVKAPVFSFAKLDKVSTKLGPEMKSTGEVMGIDRTYHAALYKAFLAAGVTVPEKGVLLATIADKDKEEALPIIRGFHELGFKIIATKGTASFLKKTGLKLNKVEKISPAISSQNNHKNPEILQLITHKEVDLIINTPTDKKQSGLDGARIRQTATEFGIPALTSLDTARAFLYALRAQKQGRASHVMTMQEYLS